MRVTDKTKYRFFERYEKYLTPESVEALKAEAEKRIAKMYDLTFAQFYDCANGDFSGVLGSVSDPTVLQVYWCKKFADFVQEFTEALKKLTIQPTGDEIKAAQGQLKTDWGEAMLVFLQQFFGLKSFKEAEQITVGEILIARRAQYNRDLYQRKMNNIQLQKMKRK